MNFVYPSYEIGDKIFVEEQKVVIEVEDIFVENGKVKIDINEYDYSGNGVDSNVRTIMKHNMDEYFQMVDTEKLTA